jgi:hypothetical protein
MQNIQGFDFIALQFDGDGNLPDTSQSAELQQAAGAATDVILFAHGFRNDENDATGLYTRFLTTFRAQLGRPEFAGIAARKFLVAGVYWPSKSYPESFPSDAGSVQDADETQPLTESVRHQLLALKADVSPAQQPNVDEAIGLLPRLENDTDAQNRFVSLLLSLVPAGETDPTEGLPLIRSQQGSDLLNKLRLPVVLPTVGGAAAGGDPMGSISVVDSSESAFGEGGGVESLGSFFGSILGGAGRIANMTTWYLMKSRSGVVGETGVARAVRALSTSLPSLKIHLVGHSLGGRLMAACARALSQQPAVHPDSLTLLEAAFSHYGFSANNGQGTPGFFRDVIAKKVVKGPMLETFSFQDTVVGTVYAIASRAAGDNVKAIGDATDQYGGIGRNGTQMTAESVVDVLHEPGTPYTFQTGIVTNLDGSGGLIQNHGDVTNEHVTYAFASAIAAT